VPFLRPLRVMRSARMLRLLRAARAGAFLLRGLDAVKDVLTRHKLHYTLLVATVVTVAAGLIVAEIEIGAPEANIDSVPDGLWWAISTVTTVGYGDAFPTTAVGRAFAVVLMLVGVSLFGLLAASLASFLIQHDDEEPEEHPAYREILNRLDRIESRLDDVATARNQGTDVR
jgi:voltage-gated potassium channel